MSIHQYYNTAATSFNQSTNIFSPEHLYNAVKFSSDCNSGTAMQTALDYIVLNGLLPWVYMPYTSGSCSLLPTPEQYVIASNYKISGYNKIYTTDSLAIKAQIKQNKAVIISISVDSYFLNAKSGFIWKDQSVPPSIGHSVIIIGWDDTKHAWKIMNSFGTSWGTNGYAYIDYDMFLARTGTWCYTIK